MDRAANNTSAAISPAADGEGSPMVPPPPPPQRRYFVYRVFSPEVVLTGMATHHEADPKPVTVLESLLGYEVRVKIPCRSNGLNLVEYGRTESGSGLFVEGSVDASECRLGRRYVHRPSMRRLYSAGEFSISFELPQRVKAALLTGKSFGDGMLKFLVIKKPFYEPDSDEQQVVQFSGNNLY